MPITIYKCNYCDEYDHFDTLQEAEEHEAECVHNPENKRCASCDHFRNNIEDSICALTGGAKYPHTKCHNNKEVYSELNSFPEGLE
jgi:hypothetical protein